MSCSTPACCTGECRQGRDCPNRSQSARGNLVLVVVLLVCFAGLLAFVGPAIDRSGESAQADAAINQIKRDNHIADVGKKVCGENAAWRMDGATLQCFTHRGSPTIRIAVNGDEK